MRCKETDCFNCKYDYCINVGNYKKHTKEQNKKYTERNRSLRSERYALGLCTSCGKRVPSKGYKTCDYCRAYFKRKKTKHDRENGILPRCILDGVDRCSKCGKDKPANGYKLCNSCLKKARSALEMARSVKSKNGVKGGFDSAIEAFWTRKANQKQKESE